MNEKRSETDVDENKNPVRKKYRFITFSPYESPEMERYLADMARRGWMLDKLGAFTMRFRREIPGEYRFSVDLYPDIEGVGRSKSMQIEAYRQCCEDAGWTFADGYRETQVFYREERSGMAEEDEVLPIQTDDGIRRRLLLKYCRRELLGYLLILLLSVFYVVAVGFHYVLLLRNTHLLLMGSFLACGLHVSLKCIYLAVKLLVLALTANKKREQVRKERNFGFLIFRKRLKFVCTAAVLAFTAGLFLAVISEQEDPAGFVIGMLPVIFGCAAGLTVRGFANRSQSPRTTRWCGLALALPAVFLVSFLVSKIYNGIADGTERETHRQSRRPVLTAGVLEETEWFEEEASSSAAVKDYYKYREVSREFDHATTIYVDAANEEIARLIYKDMIAQAEKDPFAGFLKQIEENINLLTGKLYRDRIAISEPLDPDVWGCDEGFRIGDRTFYLRKGTKILYLSVWQGTELMKKQVPQIVKKWFDEPQASAV